MKIDFNKSGGLVPVIIQDELSMQVLMLGYMNEEAFEQTTKTKLVTFYSRSRKELWVKGNTSGNYLEVKNISIDCDFDTVLIQVIPTGPACHTGSTSCFGSAEPRGFLYQLEALIAQRIDNNDSTSYTNQLFRSGINKVAQKVGEEAVELIIEAKDNDPLLFENEAADLLFHLLILFNAKHTSLSNIESVLRHRNQK